MLRGHLAVLGAAFGLLAGFAMPSPAAAGPGLVVGAVEDDVRTASLVEAESRMELLRLAGFRAVRVTTIWTPGLVRPSATELEILGNIASAATRNGVRVYVTVMHPGSRTTPLSDVRLVPCANAGALASASRTTASTYLKQPILISSSSIYRSSSNMFNVQRRVDLGHEVIACRRASA